MFYVLFYVTLCHSCIAIILMGKRELVALLNLSSWWLMMVKVPWGCLQFVIVVFPDHTDLLFLLCTGYLNSIKNPIKQDLLLILVLV